MREILRALAEEWKWWVIPCAITVVILIVLAWFTVRENRRWEEAHRPTQNGQVVAPISRTF